MTLTATVSATTPSGTVAFTEGGTAVAGCSAVPVSGTTAVCTAAVTIGTHSLVATYSGNASTFGSTSAALLQKVNPIGMTNVALASAGATTLASSTYSAGYAVSGINNDERAGTNWGNGGGWNDAGTFPAWAEIDFSGNKTIDRVIVYSVQDSYTSPIEPSDTLTFTQYGITGFTVQGWDGTSWVTLGTVSGNNLVKRKVRFAAPFTTTKIRINNISNALGGYSRLTEVEAYGANASTPASLVNNNFELPALGSGFQYTPSASGIGWTFSPATGIQGNGSPWGAAPAPTGTQTAFIQHTGSITQTLTLSAGSYTLSFQAAQRNCCVSPFVQPVKVSIDGIQIGGLISPASTTFAPFSIPFSVGTSGVHTLTFTGTDLNDKTTFIDNVTIQ